MVYRISEEGYRKALKYYIGVDKTDNITTRLLIVLITINHVTVVNNFDSVPT